MKNFMKKWDVLVWFAIWWIANIAVELYLYFAKGINCGEGWAEVVAGLVGIIGCEIILKICAKNK